jgi:hypothetical protein
VSAPACTVAGCKEPAAWTASDGLAYCAGHEREWHMAEDREDFADEYAREAKAGR